MARNKLVEQVKEQIQTTYSWLEDEELDAIYNIALSDYMALKYPSKNGRPNVANLEIDFFISQWIYKRMVDILGRAGGINLESYRENGLSLNYGASFIDPQLASQIMPNAGVPR